LTNLTTVRGAVGAGLADSNTFFVSSTAMTSGDGSMARPWNSLSSITNGPAGWMNGRTVLVLPGLYKTSAEIVFGASCSNVTVKGLDRQNVRIVSSNSANRIFTCASNATGVVIDGMTITSKASSQDGGAIYLRAGSIVRNCTFSANSGNYGGAIYCYRGGTVQDCAFDANSATNGGAIYCLGDGTIRDCDFSGNSAFNNGGAVRLSGGSARNCAFSGNSAAGAGGAVYASGGGTVEGCTFNDNTATVSGGAVNAGGSATVRNCRIVRGAGTTNSVSTLSTGNKWMSVWTNDTSASDLVIFSTSLSN
jgi:predicted outer membrane repeat protein